MNFLSKNTKKYLLLDNNVSDEKNNSEIPKKKDFLFFKPNENNINYYSKPWDGYDCRSNWENNIIELNKINENNYKMTLLQKLESCNTSQEEKIKIIQNNPKYFEKSPMFMCKKSLYKGIEKATSSQEKVLADHFDTNLGDIDIIDADKHIFKINDWNNNDVEVVIYSKEDLEVIEGNMIDHLYTELSKSKITLTDNISIELKDLVKEEAFENKMFDIFTPEFLIKTISDLLEGKYQKEKDSVASVNQGKNFIWII
jgi:hypothetical protein